MYYFKFFIRKSWFLMSNNNDTFQMKTVTLTFTQKMTSRDNGSITAEISYTLMWVYYTISYFLSIFFYKNLSFLISFGQENGVISRKSTNYCLNWATPLPHKMADRVITILTTVSPCHRRAQIPFSTIALRQFHKLKVLCILQRLVVSFNFFIAFFFCCINVNFNVKKKFEMGHKLFGRYNTHDQSIFVVSPFLHFFFFCTKKSNKT